MAFLMIGLILTVAACLFVSLYDNWAYSLVAVVIYVISGVIVNKLTKHLSNRYLRKGHFMLAAICRIENNRVFLRHKVEVRPGFLGKWV